MLLPEFYKSLYSLCESSPKIKLGNTKRKNGGVWDVVAFEKCDFSPDGVGCHHQYDGFVHYRFGYREILKRTPSNLSVNEAHELRLMVDRKKPKKIDLADNLVKYGYAYKKGDKYVPHVVVVSQSKVQKFLRTCETKRFSKEFWEHASARKKMLDDIFDTIGKINLTVREILAEDLPDCISENREAVDALLESMCTTSHILGYVIKYATESGWLKYDENTSPAIGAYFYLP